jgi:transforming growth factor-beta-induced protein
MKRIALIGSVALAVVLVAAACGGDDDGEQAATPAAATTEAMTTEQMEMDIVETAVAAGSFTTLVDLVQQAGLADELSGPGPLTVFAPTDEAFAAVPQETLDALAANPDQLKQVLLYHVVDGEVTSDQVADGASAATLAGPEVAFTVDESGVKVNDGTVVSADVMASNGVIHVIDTVLLPPS